MVAPVLKSGIILGINDEIRKKIGREPDWIHGFPAGGLTAQALYAHAACIIQMSDGEENLPRVGFEAMASGSLLIVDDRGGWRELVRHRETGFLCRDQRDFVYYASRAAYEPDERRRMAGNARAWLEANWGLEQAKREWAGFLGAIG
jgi:glycosyltransferase involved in cell wall biosynthesis